MVVSLVPIDSCVKCKSRKPMYHCVDLLGYLCENCDWDLDSWQAQKEKNNTPYTFADWLNN